MLESAIVLLILFRLSGNCIRLVRIGCKPMLFKAIQISSSATLVRMFLELTGNSLENVCVNV